MSKSKLLTCLLVCAMLTPMFASCGENTDVQENVPENTDSVINETETEAAGETETEPEETQLSDGLEDVNMNGFNFRILSTIVDDIELSDYITYEEMTGDPLKDTLYESHAYLEDRFNISITTNSVPLAESASVIINSTTAGNDDYDLVLNHDVIGRTSMDRGALANLLNFEQFDFEKPWWGGERMEELTIKGRMYFASNYASYAGLAYTTIIYMNKDYAEDLNVEVPYDMVREGTWTLDALFSLMDGTSVDTNGDGVLGIEDKRGFTTGGASLYALQESADIEFYPRDSEGNIYLDIDQERVDSFVTKLRKIMESPDFEDAGYFDYGNNVFVKGNTLLCYSRISDAYIYYRNEDFRYGFLPAPKLDEKQKDYVNSGTDHPWGIPITVYSEEHKNNVGTIMEAMSCYNYNNVIPAYFETTVKTRLADSPDDAEMLQLIADTRTFNFAKFHNIEYRALFNTFIYQGNEPASHFAATQKAAQTTLDRFLSKFDRLPE